MRKGGTFPAGKDLSLNSNYIQRRKYGGISHCPLSSALNSMKNYHFLHLIRPAYILSLDLFEFMYKLHLSLFFTSISVILVLRMSLSKDVEYNLTSNCHLNTISFKQFSCIFFIFMIPWLIFVILKLKNAIHRRPSHIHFQYTLTFLMSI